MPSRPKAPLSSFGPEVFNALVEGSRKEFRVYCTYSEAVRFRVRAHKLRREMRDAGHDLYEVASKTNIRIVWDQDKVPTLTSRKRVRYPRDSNAPVTLIIGPHDSQFAQALEKAGLKVHDIGPNTDMLNPGGESRPSALDSFLDDLNKNKDSA